MMSIVDLDRAWTLAEVTELLWSQGVSLRPQVGGYRLNYRTGGLAKTEVVTDDLIDALLTGLRMAQTPPPAPPTPPRKRRRGPGRFGVRRNGEAKWPRRRRR